MLAAAAAVNCWFPRWPGADACSTQERLLLCWLHAGRLLASFLQGGLDASSLTQELRRKAVLGWVDLFRARWAFGDDAAHPASLHRSDMLLHALQHARGDRASSILGAKRIQHLRKSVLNENEIGQALTLPVLRNAWPDEDALGSFLAESLQPLLAQLFGEQVGACVAPDVLIHLTSLHAEELVAGKRETDSWLGLAVLIGDRAAPTSVLDLLPAALAATPVELPDVGDLGAAAIQIRFLAVQAARSGRSDIAEAVERLLAGLASGNDATTKSETTDMSRRRAALLLDAALAFSRREQSETTAREFAALLPRLGQANGTIRQLSMEVLARLCRELPLSVGEHLWPRLLELRSST